ncbi:MAG TPA: hypothetical protein VLA88_04940 [Candidatus Saccharimonadales bacterium]|nr:hypothetical protein [Candidatus Saccharimonadales bacterium]
MSFADIRSRLHQWATAHRPHVELAQGGLVHTIYMFWRRQSKKKIGQENFCHLVRVLLFWAPLFLLRNLMVAGPKVGAMRIWVIPTLTLTGGLLTVGCLSHTLVQGITWVGLGLWGLLGLLMTYMWGMILKEWFWGTFEGFDVEIGSSRTAKVVFIVATVLALPVIVAFGVLALVLGPLGYGLLLLALKLFDNWELHLKVQAAYKWFIDLHPPRLSWLTPKWLLLVPIGYFAWRFEVIRIGLVLFGTWSIVVTTAVLTANHINKKYRTPARERARRDKELRHRLTMEKRRMQWSQLAATPEFWAWLWDSDDPFAKGMRKHAITRKATRDETPIMFVTIMGNAEMEMAENLFLSWRLNMHNYSWDARPVLPSRPSALTSIRWVVATGRGLRWLLTGIGQIVMVALTAIWSAKVVGICPLIDIKPANNDGTTTA